MKNLQGKTAVITGAASGIGRSLAVDMARRGCRVAIADVAEAKLKETAALLSGGPDKVSVHVVDVADREAVMAFADECIATHGAVDIVINNAGVAVADSLLDVSWDDFEWVMNINFWGVVYGTKAFLPHLLERPEASVVNISSVNAFLPFPHNGPYNCSKYAVCGFSETLHQELEGTGVVCTSVHPGGIKTSIAENMRFRKSFTEGLDHKRAAENFRRVARTTSEEAARQIIKAIQDKKRRLLIGTDAHVIEALKRIAPESAVQWTAKLMPKAIRRNR